MAVERRFYGFKPYSFQKAVTDKLCTRDAKGKGKIVVCKSSRQKGKSFMISNVLLYYAINFERTKNFCVSPTLKQSKEIYKTIINAITESGIVKSSNATDLTIKLINGSTINFKSAEQGEENLRGYTCSGILCIDECSFIEDNIFNVILPWVDYWHSNILMTSTPYIKNGFFYQYFNFGLEHQNNCETVDWCDEEFKEDILKIMSAERLEMYRQTLPRNTFKTEYLGEWLDDDGTVFINITNCILNCSINKTDRLWIGIDWANQGENDYTVVSMFNQDGHQVFLRYFNDSTPLQQIDRIFEYLKPYLNQIVVIQSELNSIGTPYSDLLKERSALLASKIIGVNTSNTNKNSMVANMQVALENKEVTLLDDDKQKREFGYFTATYNPKTRNVSYAAPVGLHDDTVMATLFAYDAYKNNQKSGAYTLSFPSKNKHKDNRLRTKYGN